MGKFSTGLGGKTKNIWSSLGYKDCQRAGWDVIEHVVETSFPVLPLLGILSSSYVKENVIKTSPNLHKDAPKSPPVDFRGWINIIIVEKG